MIHLNAEAERTKNYTIAANLYFEDGGRSANSVGESFPHKLARWTLRHLELGWIFAVAFGDRRNSAWHRCQSRWSRLGREFLVLPALCKQSRRSPCWHCLSLFPFSGSAFARRSLRFSFTGYCRSCGTPRAVLQDIPRSLRESAVALGLSPFTRLWEIYLPMASRSILSGIKTSAVINIGTATLAALIGAGGLGEPILERP